MEKSIYSREYSAFLRLLRDSRERVGLTQSQLGKKLDCTQSFISKCERGERRVDIVEFRRICNALGLDFVQVAKRLDVTLRRRGQRARR